MTEIPTARILGLDIPDPLVGALDTHRQDRLFRADALTPDSPLTPVLSTTEHTYRRVFRRVDPKTVSVAAQPRAASVVRRRLRATVAASVRDAVQAYQANDHDGLRAAVDRLTRGVDALEAWAPASGVLGPGGARRRRRRRRGKGRRNLRDLPQNWVIALLQAAPRDDRPWIAALYLSGARAGVLETHGIRFQVTSTTIHLTVPDSKGGFATELVYDRRQRVADAMARYVAAQGGAVTLSDSYDRIKARHRRLTRSVFGRPLPLSIHRHQLHADLKRTGWSRVDIARATGKRSTRAVSVYATAHQGHAGRGGHLKLAPAPSPDRAPTPAPAVPEADPKAPEPAPAPTAHGSMPAPG